MLLRTAGDAGRWENRKAEAVSPKRTLPHQRRRDRVELKTLLARCRDGDEIAKEALVREYQGRVFAMAELSSGAG